MKFLCSILILSFLITSCGDKTKENADREALNNTIATVNYPLAYFAERLVTGIDGIEVLFEAPADEDPAFWQPSDEEMNKIQQCRVILMNGAHYAKWAESASLPHDRVVNTSLSFVDSYIEVENAVTHAHSKDGEEHSHEGLAFTTWMDFGLAQKQADAAAQGIAKAFPEHKEAIMSNLSELLKDLKYMDGLMKFGTAKIKNGPVIASHPVYQYWERAYDLEIVSLMWEPEMELDEKAIADLKQALEFNDAKYFLWEGQPLPEHVERLRKEFGLESVVISPCGNRPASGDLKTEMKANADRLEALGN